MEHDLAEKQIVIQLLKKFLTLWRAPYRVHKSPPEDLRIVS
jgi:hypothetical protein